MVSMSRQTDVLRFVFHSNVFVNFLYLLIFSSEPILKYKYDNASAPLIRFLTYL